MAKLTVAWDRAENAPYLPRDSSEVTVAPKLTVAWGPMLQQSVLDWDPADLLVTPGAGVPETTTTPTDTTTAATTPTVTVPGETVTAPAPDGGTTATVPVPVPGGSGTGGLGAGAGAGGTPGAPDIRVASRRTAGLFRKEGLLVEVVAPADAGVRAVLVAAVPRRGANGRLASVERRLSQSKLVTVQAGRRERFRLKISGQGRRALAELDRIEATLQVAVTYGKAKPIRLSRKVVLVKKRG